MQFASRSTEVRVSRLFAVTVRGKCEEAKRAIAALLIATQLSGCTIALGNAYAEHGQTQDQLDLANSVCTQEPRPRPPRELAITSIPVR